MTAQVAVLFDTRTTWYVTRATGIVSIALLTASGLLGVTQATRWMTERWPRFVTARIHKNISLLATTFIGVHVATAIVDGSRRSVGSTPSSRPMLHTGRCGSGSGQWPSTCWSLSL